MLYNNLPSVKTLGRIKGSSPELAKQLRKTLETRVSNPIRTIMRECDALLGSHGVEYLPNRGYGTLGVDYLNMGDPYDTTLIYDFKASRFIVGSWGNLVERNPSRFE